MSRVSYGLVNFQLGFQCIISDFQWKGGSIQSVFTSRFVFERVVENFLWLHLRLLVHIAFCILALDHILQRPWQVPRFEFGRFVIISDSHQTHDEPPQRVAIHSRSHQNLWSLDCSTYPFIVSRHRFVHIMVTVSLKVNVGPKCSCYWSSQFTNSQSIWWYYSSTMGKLA